MDLITTDIVIVGAGGAGLRAAIAVAEGGAAGVVKDDDSVDKHFATPLPAAIGCATRTRPRARTILRSDHIFATCSSISKR